MTYDRDDLASAFLDLVVRPDGKREERIKATADRPDLTTAEARDARDPRAGVDLHDLLPPRRLPQHQHRPRRRADRRHRARAGRDVLAQRHRRRAYGRQRLHRGLRHLRRHPGLRPRRRGVADGDDDVQRRVLRRPRGRRAQAPLLLHRPLPDGTRGDGRVGLGRPAVPQRHPPRRADHRRRHAQHGLVLGRGHGPHVVDQDVGHHHPDRRPHNFTEEQTRRVDTRQCHPNDGYGGFDVDVWRYFRRPGSSELVRTGEVRRRRTPRATP